MIKVEHKDLAGNLVTRYFSCMSNYIAEEGDCPSVLGRHHGCGWAWEEYTNKEANELYLEKVKELGSELGAMEVLQYFGKKLFEAAKRGENGLLMVVEDGVRTDYTASDTRPDFESWYIKAAIGLGLAESIEHVDEIDHEEAWSGLV